ncbi:MAG: CBS domain-containing protein, partial [Pseudomonadota bacterium]
MTTERSIDAILAQTHPYDALTPAARSDLAGRLARREVQQGDTLQTIGAEQEALYLILTGQVEVTDDSGEIVSILGPGNSFGERGLLRAGIAVRTATATEATEVVVIPATVFSGLIDTEPAFRRFFERRRSPATARRDLATLTLGEVMTAKPNTCPATATVREAAAAMRADRHSSLVVVEGARPVGIITTRDMTYRAVADDLPADAPVTDIMTRDPIAMSPDALLSDVLHRMVEFQITHILVTEGEALV